MIIFPIILVFVLFANYYIGWHGAFIISYFSLPIPIILYWVLFWVVSFSYVLGRIIPGPIGRLIKVMGSIYFAFMQYSLILLILMDLSAWIMNLSGISPTQYVPILLVVYLILLIIVFGIGSFMAWSPIKRTYNVHINKKAGSLKELKIAVASDLHLGNIVGNRHLSKLVKEFQAMQPDLILLVGDVLDDVIEPFLRNKMVDKLKLLQARYGTYAVLGNHEYIGKDIKRYVKEMKSIQIPVLRDQTILVEDSFYIVGRKDKTAERADPDGRLSMLDLVKDVDPSLPIIAMDHQPHQFDKALAAGVDILLCGHTHRGQMAPNHLITKRLFELDWGYILKEKMHVIVSSGFGLWGPPIRLGSRSEFIELTVTFDE
ncbi:hypothetical protein SAMN05444392_101779 [Seinonella peptonophila]|uniref:Calcineurin-like phosphoesterase domain-containing protein n=1 Tax=Seinonella peptonophila TaxID=112248 RepID=A0A1M4U3B3_9BACL|nr:metallophosphoesterase [Seinonella peptonophila]SHE51017.1 hypothetical protein SAMN05444392_101779 [Seinonella peptonophila]